jgi:thiol-disulfide isomerase/thioredoxin
MKGNFTKGLIVLFLLLSLTVKPTSAQEDKVIIYLFWGKGCPHCTREQAFLEKLTLKYPQIEIKNFEVNTQPGNLKLLQKVGQKLKASISGVPFTVIGDNYFSGYLSDETTGQEIEKAIQCALENGCPDVVGDLVPPSSSSPGSKQTPIIPDTLDLPFLGEIKTQHLSLPLLTIVLGLLDGFNPCAMWVLLFLISLLLSMKDRKRMWLLGISFIIASGLVYFLFMAAWLNFFLFLGLVFWVRLAVGFVALSSGVYNLRGYWVNREGGCPVAGDEKRQKTFTQIRNIVGKQELFLAIGGIALLAFAVNLVELVCSAGLPAIYTQILSLNRLSVWQYYSYLLFYLLFFIIDDLFVFSVATITLQATGIQDKYARYSRLIGGGMMVLIGFFLIFKPEVLMFG